MKFDYSYITEKNINKNDILLKAEEPIITVVTPFFNGGKYICDTAKAVLNQTFPFFEWLIIDDGSKDSEGLKKIDEIAKSDSRVTVYHKKNTGLANTRDFGAKKSAKTAKYIMFLDDDDIIDNTYLECAYWTLETNKGASWAFTDVIHFGEYNALATTRYNPKEEIKQNVLVATALIKKKDFEKVGGYGLKEKAINEDWNLWIKMIAADMYPVRMSFFGFWYRRKNSNESELYKASKNKKRTQEIISETTKKITNPKEGIQYPRQDYNWDIIKENFDNIIIPQYKINKKVKILMIIPWMVIGGADKFNIDLINGLDKEKFEVTLITTEPNYNIWREKYENNVKAIYDLTSFLDRKYWVSFINYIIKKNNIDIILNSNSTFGYSVLPALKSIHPNIPIIDYIHMEEWYNRNGGFSRDSSAIESVIDETFVCNENSKKILTNHFKRDKDEIKTVYIGVDEEKFNPENFNRDIIRKKYNIEKNVNVITFMARIDYQKRPILFMNIAKEILNKIENTIIIVAGDGPLLNKMIEMAKKYRIYDKMKFLGAVKNTEEVYSISDLTVNCSIKEGLALTTYESLSMGVPVISARVGGQAEIISEDVGITVDCLQNEADVMNIEYTNEEIDLYVNGIEKIFNNLEFYKKNSRKRVLNGFTIKQMIENMSDELLSIRQNPNKKKIKNGELLKSNKDICFELITKYFIAFSEEYKWLAEEFNRKVDRAVNESIGNFIEEKNQEKISLKKKIIKIATKLHIYNEVIIVYKIIKVLIEILKSIVKSIIALGRYIFIFFKLIFIRIINIFRYLFKKKKIEFKENDF